MSALTVERTCSYCDGTGQVPGWEHLYCDMCKGKGDMKLELIDTYQIGDALEAVQSLPDACIDLVVTDPAYDSLEKWRSMGTTTRLSQSKSSSNQWFDVVGEDYLFSLLKECYRVLKPDSHLYLVSDYETNVKLATKAPAIGFELKKSLIWEKVGKEKLIHCPSCGSVAGKKQGLGSPGMGYPYRSSYEMILFLAKGKRKIPENKGVRDVLKFPRIKGKDYYPTQKPEALLSVLMEQSSDPGDIVLDPFAGSGSTLVAAKRLGRHFLGVDINPEAKEYYENRNVEGKYKLPPKEKEDSKLSILDMIS